MACLKQVMSYLNVPIPPPATPDSAGNRNYFYAVQYFIACYPSILTYRRVARLFPNYLNKLRFDKFQTCPYFVLGLAQYLLYFTIIVALYFFQTILNRLHLKAKLSFKWPVKSRSIDQGDHYMIGEFVHAGKWYIIKNKAEPVAEDEWTFEFKTFKDLRLFLEGVVGNKFSRNDLLEIAAFFLPFAGQLNKGDSSNIQEQHLQLLVQELLEGNLVLLCKKPSKMPDWGLPCT